MAWHCCRLLLLVLVSVGIMAQEETQLQSVLKGNGQLTKNVYNILSKEQGQNIFFSPISIHAVLSMAAQGAGGSTRDVFTQVLGVPNLQVAADGYQDVMQLLNSAENITLHIANKIFLMDSYTLNSNFKSIVSGKFLSEVDNVDFAESAVAAKTINNWVEAKTNNKIKDLITPDSVNADTRLVLVNAIYFKGQWQEKFDAAQTTTEKFYLNDKDTVDVKMMHISKKFLYKEDSKLNAKLLEMPYQNSAFSMLFILPNDVNGIAELERKLAQTDLTKLTQGMYKPEVIVSLPKFKIETTMDLKDTLTELGLGEIFSSKANFTGMLNQDEPLAVSKVIQKAFIEVNEEGAEAAAATGLDFVPLSIPPAADIFNANHPFIVLLRVKQRGQSALLFDGRIFNPTYEIRSPLNVHPYGPDNSRTLNIIFPKFY